jgi:hypothetical protein
MGMHRYAALMRRAIVSAVVPTGCLGGCQIVKISNEWGETPVAKTGPGQFCKESS